MAHSTGIKYEVQARGDDQGTWVVWSTHAESVDAKMRAEELWVKMSSLGFQTRVVKVGAEVVRSYMTEYVPIIGISYN